MSSKISKFDQKKLFTIYCCVDTQNDKYFGSLKSVFSMMMTVPIIPFLYERETGKTEWEESKRGRKREMYYECSRYWLTFLHAF
jgi:hypothetical protein